MSSQYKDSGNSMQKIDGGQTRQAENMVADNRGYPRELQKSSSGIIRFPSASNRGWETDIVIFGGWFIIHKQCLPTDERLC